MSATASTDLLSQAPPRHHALLLRRPPQGAPMPAAPIPARPIQAVPQRHVFAALDLDPRPAAPLVSQPDPLPGLLAAERAAGFAEGQAAGRAAAAAEREEMALATLRLAAAHLADAAPAARVVAEQSASAVAGLMVAALTAALPAMASQLAEEEVAAFAARILPFLVEEPRVELRVCPGLVAPLAARFASLPAVSLAADPALAEGDVSLRWHGGQAERRAAEARAAVAEILASTGFLSADMRQH